MSSGGYNVIAQIKQLTQKALIICSERDQIVNYKQAVRLQLELQDASMRLIPDCGHLPHVDKPSSVARFIAEFARGDCN
nr:hypothetical protein CFP56_08408 [Quercus suber]